MTQLSNKKKLAIFVNIFFNKQRGLNELYQLVKWINQTLFSNFYCQTQSPPFQNVSVIKEAWLFVLFIWRLEKILLKQYDKSANIFTSYFSWGKRKITEHYAETGLSQVHSVESCQIIWFNKCIIFSCDIQPCFC